MTAEPTILLLGGSSELGLAIVAALLEREEYAPLAVVAQIVGYVGEAETPERLDAVFAADVDDYAAEVEKKVARHRHVRGYSTVHVSPARIGMPRV